MTSEQPEAVYRGGKEGQPAGSGFVPMGPRLAFIWFVVDLLLWSIKMIIREWRGRASLENAEAYPEHFRTRVLPELAHIAGFRGGHLAKCEWNDGVEFLVLTRWASMDAIHAFAGDEVSKAVVEPGAVAALVDFDASVRHYEIVEDVLASEPP